MSFEIILRSRARDPRRDLETPRTAPPRSSRTDLTLGADEDPRLCPAIGRLAGEFVIAVVFAGPRL